jgi:predicted HicB family RNase H-like nuclease
MKTMKKFDPEMYTISVQKVSIEGETLYLAKVAELNDVREYGDTETEARELALDTIRTAHEMFQEQNMQFPEPNSTEDSDVSGRVTLRMPKSVHQHLIREAQAENSSLNQVVLTALTSYLEKRSVAKVIEAELLQIKKMYRQPELTRQKAFRDINDNLQGIVRLQYVAGSVEFESSHWDYFTSSEADSHSWHPALLQTKTKPLKLRKVN